MKFFNKLHLINLCKNDVFCNPCCIWSDFERVRAKRGLVERNVGPRVECHEHTDAIGFVVHLSGMVFK